ncbi:photosystem II S4 domain protein [Metallumcola ferriviriculae]|uniref:Photosystem II S4 domain protein n=1 Tax=Metallumcola ferriviriculae TaxID=3039180 RepID=A0AAU0UP96_9FIRM|nr:photosystem II S4 domain protein [Desulfitibacteraceae bacterium MK1]
MLDRQQLLSHINDREARETLIRLLDLVDNAIERNKEQISNFLDPYHAELAVGVLKNIADISFDFLGGYAAAERKRLVVAPQFIAKEQLSSNIVCLWIEGNFSFIHVSHRDFLGAILSMGIKREMVGDLLVMSQGCQVLMDREVAQYADINLTSIHQVPVTTEIRSVNNLEFAETKSKTITATVASMRLDTVAAAGFGVSRSKMSSEIKAQRVRLNWKPETNSAADVEVGDLISCRNRGRVMVKEIKGKSKKGRQHLVLERWI